MKQHFLYIFSCLVILTFSMRPGIAQQVTEDQLSETMESGRNAVEAEDDSLFAARSDSLLIATDTLSGRFFRRIEIYLDYLKFASFLLPTELKGEIGLAVITGPNIGWHAEVGYGKKLPEDHFENAEYSVFGYYGRIGFQYHYPYDPGTNFMIGFMYGYSMYQDEAVYTITSSLWDDYQDGFERKDLTGQWAELVAGSESSYRGSFYFGFQFRFRVLISHDNFSPFEVFSIPGYGRTMNKTVPALNLYVKYMIDFER